MTDTRYDFNNNSVRAVIVIGDVPTIPISYSLSMNSLNESDLAQFHITSDLIDMRKISQKYRLQDTYVKIELWTGYFNTQNIYHSFNEAMIGYPSNDDLKRYLVNNQNYKRLLKRRWFGVLDMPSFTWGDVRSADITTLTCKEVFTLLDDYTFEKKYEEEQATVQAVLQDLQRTITAFTIKIDEELLKNTKKMNLNLGAKAKINKDDGSTETVDKGYNTIGKSFFQVIKDVCQKAKIDFVQDTTDPFTYIFKEPKSSDKLWILDRVKDFTSCSVNFGKFGHSNGSKIGIITKSVQEDGSVLVGTFPRNLDNSKPESKKVIIKTLKPHLKQEELDERASAIALNYGKYQLTGSMTIPNGIPDIKPDHLLQLKDSTPFTGYDTNRRMTNIIGDINFRINAIKEEYSESHGLSQSVEFELDITNNLNKIDYDTGEIKAFDLMPNSKDASKINDANNEVEMIAVEKLLSQKLKDIREGN